MSNINSFKGKYDFLSNFYPVKIVVENITYPSVEHAYVAMKTLDNEIRKKIAEIENPGEVKRFGRTIMLREDWEQIKIPVMLGLLIYKFNQSPLKEILKSTGDAHLEEGNWWGDTFWGVCRGEGQNHLGKLLMLVRQQL